MKFLGRPHIPLGTGSELIGLKTFFDPIYFSVVTGTTLGYGELHPKIDDGVGQLLVIIQPIIIIIFALNMLAFARSKFKTTDEQNSSCDVHSSSVEDTYGAIMDNQSIVTMSLKSDNLMELYIEFETNAKFVLDKIWQSVKFFTTITSALLTISVGMYGSEILLKASKGDNSIESLLLIVIPTVIIMISYIGIKNLKREYKRFLEWIVVVKKTEEALGLHENFVTKVFPQDKYLLPEIFVTTNYSKSEDFIEHSLRKKGSLYYYFKMLHILYIIFSLFILSMVLTPFFKIFLEPLCL